MAATASAAFTQTARFKEAVALINAAAVDAPSRFVQFVSRVLRAAAADDDTKRAFSAAEREKLPAALSLPVPVAGAETQVTDALVDGCTYILEQAAYHTMHPAALAEQLRSAGLSDDKASAFAEAWRVGAAPLLDRLRAAPMAPLSLAGVDWRLHLQLARQLPRAKQQLLQQQYQQQIQQQQQQDVPPPPTSEVLNAPSAIFEFALTDDSEDGLTDQPTTTSTTSTSKKKRSFVVELTKNELAAFYAQLERIQDQLDNLS